MLRLFSSSIPSLTLVILSGVKSIKTEREAIASFLTLKFSIRAFNSEVYRAPSTKASPFYIQDFLFLRLSDSVRRPGFLRVLLAYMAVTHF